MTATSVGRSNQHDLFWNLLTETHPDTGNSRSQATDMRSMQPETIEKEGRNQPESIPFQEILGQQIDNEASPDAFNAQKTNHPAGNTNTTKLLLKDVEETDSSEFQETFSGGNSKKSANKSMLLSSLEEGMDGFSSTAKKGQKGSGQNPSEEQTGDTIHSSGILPGRFIENTETVSQTLSQASFFNDRVVKDTGKGNMYHPFILDVNHRNYSLSPASEGEPKETDLSIDNPLIDVPGLDSVFTAKASTISDSTVRTIISNTHNLGLPAPNNHKHLQKLDQKNFTINPVAQSLYSEHALDSKELPASFKIRAQDVSPESSRNVFMPEINNQVKTAETFMKNEVPNIHDRETSKPDISSILQTPEEGNSSDDFSQQGSIFNPTPSDTPLQNTPDRSSFFIDPQLMAHDMTSDKTTLSQETEVFPGNGAAHSLSGSGEDRREGVIHTSQRNSFENIEHAYNIMDQLFQKISMISHGEKSEIRMHLTPPELGSVKIHFTEENEEIEAKIFVESAEVKAVIENNAHRLKESVAANGMEINKLEVYIQTNHENKQTSSENHHAHNHHLQSRNKESRDGHQSGNERNASSNVQTEISITMSNLMVDYII